MLFLTIECQPKNVVGMIEIEKHHLTNTIILVSGENHCGMLKLSRLKCDEKQDICTVSKYFPQTYSFGIYHIYSMLYNTGHTKGKIVNLQRRNLVDITLTK